MSYVQVSWDKTADTYVQLQSIAVPLAPTNVKAINITKTTATISWTGNSSANGYIVQDRNNNIIANLDGINKTSYELSGLEPETIYMYKVFAINSEGQSEKVSVTFATRVEDIVWHKDSDITWSTTDKGSAVTLSNGNLTIAVTTGYTNGNIRSTKGVSSGKWYWEVKPLSGVNHMIGIANSNASLSTVSWLTGSNDVRLYYMNNGNKYPDAVTYGLGYAINNIIGVALDMDLGTLTFYKNGVSQGIAYTDIKSAVGNVIYPYHTYGISGSTGSHSSSINFGAITFTYPVPDGYLPLDQSLKPIKLSSGSVKSSLQDMKIGDAIWCKYTATSGVAGSFSELGVSDATAKTNEIPVAGTATPNGYFRFWKVRKGMCVSDRVVQTGVSWDVLNSAKYIEGIKCRDKSLLPLMTSSNTPAPYVISASKEGYAYSMQFYAYMAFDSDINEWITGSGTTLPQWLCVDLGVPKVINAYSINPISGASLTSPIKSWIFQGSNDNVSWENLNNVTNGFASNHPYNAYKDFLFNNIVPYRYYRIYITEAYSINSTAGIGIANLKLYGEDAPYKTYNIRSLSGGNSYLDANGNSSTTNANLGAYPNSNEWDRYIVKSDLNGKIVAGDDNVWHWSNATYGTTNSWCQDTPYTSNSNRTLRGKINLDVSGGSSNVFMWYGFRPVLTYEE